MFDYEQNKTDRLVAADQASKLGSRPHVEPIFAAIFTFMGVFFGLEFFSVIAVNELEKLAVPIIAFAACSACAAYWITHIRERKWRSRFDDALGSIERAREP
jgi:hypothetical protein